MAIILRAVVKSAITGIHVENTWFAIENVHDTNEQQRSNELVSRNNPCMFTR